MLWDAGLGSESSGWPSNKGSQSDAMWLNNLGKLRNRGTRRSRSAALNPWQVEKLKKWKASLRPQPKDVQSIWRFQQQKSQSKSLRQKLAEEHTRILVSNCFNMFQYVSICFNMFQYVSICFNQGLFHLPSKSYLHLFLHFILENVPQSVHHYECSAFAVSFSSKAPKAQLGPDAALNAFDEALGLAEEHLRAAQFQKPRTSTDLASTCSPHILLMCSPSLGMSRFPEKTQCSSAVFAGKLHDPGFAQSCSLKRVTFTSLKSSLILGGQTLLWQPYESE